MYTIGVDLGGSHMSAGLVTAQGDIVYQQQLETGVGRPYHAILRDMADLIVETVKQANCTMDQVDAIGIGSPGVADPLSGRIVFANNLFWHDVPVRDELQRYINLPVYIDNDANVACLAEFYAGACRGKRNAVLLTLGTGIGGGLILDGRLHGGSHRVGAEIGHMTLVIDGEQCTCGNRGCFERYASATALIAAGKKAAQANPEGAIAGIVEGQIDQIRAKTVIDCARQGDPQAIEIYNQYIHALSLGIVSLINLLDPEVIALGGGVSHAGEFLLDAVRIKVAQLIMYKDLPHADIVLAALGNDAGIVGAAMLGRQAGQLTAS